MASRIRSRGGFWSKSHPMSHTATARFGGCSQPLTTQAYNDPVKTETIGDYWTMTDVVTKDFHVRSAKGEVIVSPMNQRHTVINPAVFSGRIAYKAKTIQCSGATAFQTEYVFPVESMISWVDPTFKVPPSLYWNPQGAITGSEIENALMEASTRCHSERGRSPITLWEALAERRQAYALLGEYCKRAKEITLKMEQDAYNNRIKLPSRILRMTRRGFNVAAGAWLMTRYGLMPLLSDIQALKKQLGTPLDEAERHTARGKAVAGRAIQSNQIFNWDGDFTVTYSKVTTDEVTVRAMSLDEWKYSTLDHYGLGGKDLVTLPWELLTLSFVADWFVNVGDFIRALVPTPGLNQLGSCHVLTQTRSVTLTSGLFQPAGAAQILEHGTLTKTGTITERARIPGLRAPSLVVLNRTKIDPELNKNTMRIVDATALIGQRLIGVSLHIDKLFSLK